MNMKNGGVRLILKSVVCPRRKTKIAQPFRPASNPNVASAEPRQIRLVFRIPVGDKKAWMVLIRFVSVTVRDSFLQLYMLKRTCVRLCLLGKQSTQTLTFFCGGRGSILNKARISVLRVCSDQA